jgi:hypothetical protein
MQGAKNERWKLLCAQAAEEHDTEKLLALVKEISDLLAAKHRLATTGESADSAAD